MGFEHDKDWEKYLAISREQIEAKVKEVSKTLGLQHGRAQVLVMLSDDMMEKADQLLKMSKARMAPAEAMMGYLALQESFSRMIREASN